MDKTVKFSIEEKGISYARCKIEVLNYTPVRFKFIFIMGEDIYMPVKTDNSIFDNMSYDRMIGLGIICN